MFGGFGMQSRRRLATTRASNIERVKNVHRRRVRLDAAKPFDGLGDTRDFGCKENGSRLKLKR